jgi:hypothetical protein
MLKMATDKPVKRITFLADGVTQVQLEALQRLLHADNLSSLMRRLINEEYLSNEADIIARSQGVPGGAKP